MATNDLTTLADVKSWLGRNDTNSDGLLAALISRASRQILSYLQRPLLLPHAVNELRDGTGGKMLQLKEWPILAIASVSVDGIAIPQSASPRQPGWQLSPWNGVPPGRAQTLSLSGYAFCEGRANVALAYSAGYQVTNEGQLVESGTAAASAAYGPWATDVGVTYANGAPLLRVTGAPSPGQYALDAEAGTYDFATADDGATVLLSYGYVPADLADACVELVAERYKYAQRIGEKTHSLGGNETVGFDTTRFTPLVMSLLQPYRSIAPL